MTTTAHPGSEILASPLDTHSVLCALEANSARQPDYRNLGIRTVEFRGLRR